MTTHLRDVPDCAAQNEITQTRFWGGANRMQCVQITQRRDKSNPPNDTDKWFNSMQLTRHQAKMLAVELMLFAEGREVEMV
jgi:hypothetical protein